MIIPLRAEMELQLRGLRRAYLADRAAGERTVWWRDCIRRLAAGEDSLPYPPRLRRGSARDLLFQGAAPRRTGGAAAGASIRAARRKARRRAKLDYGDFDAHWLERALSPAFPELDRLQCQKLAEETFEVLADLKLNRRGDDAVRDRLTALFGRADPGLVELQVCERFVIVWNIRFARDNDEKQRRKGGGGVGGERQIENVEHRRWPEGGGGIVDGGHLQRRVQSVEYRGWMPRA